MDDLLGRPSWVQLVRARDSLLSKAISAVSVSAFLLTNVQKLGDLMADSEWRLFVAMAGGVIYTLGCLYCTFRAPIEFSDGRGIPMIVAHMLQAATPDRVSGRLGMTTKLVERAQGPEWGRFPAAELHGAEYAIRMAQNVGAQGDRLLVAGALFDADLKLRQYADRQGRRYCAAMLAGGLFLIALPTLCSIAAILRHAFSPD